MSSTRSARTSGRLVKRVALLACAMLVPALAVTASASPAAAWQSKPTGICTNQPVRFNFYIGAAPAEYQAPLRRAAAAWNAAGTPVRISIVSSPSFIPGVSSMDTELDPSPRQSSYAAMGTACLANGEGKFRLSFNKPNLDTLSDRDREWVFIHELGHAFGLNHTYIDRCLSNVYVNFAPGQCPGQSTGPRADDIAGVLNRFAPNQTAGFPANSAISVGTQSLRSTNGLNWLTRSEPEFTTPTDSDLFRWTFVPEPGSATLGRVVNTGSGACLVDSDDQDTIITVDHCGNPGVYWNISSSAQGTQLRSRASGRCVGLKSYFFGSAYGASVACTDPSARLQVGAPATTVIHDESKRSLLDIGHPLIGQGSGKCLDVTDGNRNPGGTLQLWPCADGANQHWLHHVDTGALGVYEVDPYSTPAEPSTTVNPALCLQTTSTAEDAPVTTSTCQGTANQKWEMRADGGVYNPQSQRCLGVRGRATSDRSPVVLATCSWDSSTLWNMPALLTDGAPVTIHTFEQEGKVLTAQGGHGVLQTGTNSRQQFWTYIPNAHQSYGVLANKATGQCLAATSTPHDITALQPCDSANVLQQWKPDVNSNGGIVLHLLADSQCLDVFGSVPNPGAPIGNYDCWGSTNQEWRALPNLAAPPAETDIAASGRATQSSTFDTAAFGPASAAKAIDGNIDGDFSGNSVTHTNAQSQPWWQVDLGKAVQFNTITIFNRTDCCGERLTNFWVFKSQTPFNTALTPQQQATQPGVDWYHYTGTTPQDIYTWTDEHTQDPANRYVLIQLENTDPLSLAEVRITNR